MKRDEIYTQALERITGFRFDESVVSVFPDMISRSVPGYGAMLAMIELLAGKFGVENTNVYDLGCSLGAATFLMQKRLPPSCKIQAVDNSPAMVEKLKQKIAESSSDAAVCPILVQESDIQKVTIHEASLVVLNLTLQFVPLAERAALLQRASDGTLPGGALLLSEKICFEDPIEQELMTVLHHDFKRANGYSDLEIAQKRTALENTLIPETLETHTSRLKSVGFKDVMLWFQCFNFVSILAVK